MPTTVVRVTGLAHGGEAVGRLPDGRAVFVGHTVPGESVAIDVVEQHPRWARGHLVDVIEASEDRVEPPCPYFAPGRCGGCALQHIAAPRRRALLRQVVVDAFERLGHLPDPPVDAPVAAGEYHYRNRARFGVDHGGRLGFRKAGSTSLIPIERCWLLDDATTAVHQHVLDGWSGAAEVEVRSGVDSAAVVVYPTGPDDGVRAPATTIPLAVARRDGTSRSPGEDATLVEEVSGVVFRVSPTSFFQSNRVGAEALTALVRDAAAVGAGDTVLDLFSGVGLFARALAADGASVTAVEGHRASARDAAANLEGHAETVRAPVEAAVAALRDAGRKVDVTVLDPPRKGASRAVLDAVAAITARTVVYVSCNPAALARDAAAFRDQGWSLLRATPVDQFAQTASVEVVATFAR